MLKGKIILHPILFSIYPIAFIYSLNLDRVSIIDVITSFVFVGIISILIWVIAAKLTGNVHNGAFITSVFMILFFGYGSLLLAVENLLYMMVGYDEPVVFAVSTPPVLVGVLFFVIVFFLLSILLIKKSKLRANLLTTYLNLVSILLLSFVITKIGLFMLEQNRNGIARGEEGNIDLLSSSPLIVDKRSSEALMPDIYYIILDGYARQDVLSRKYGFDNSYFLDSLRDRGFYVADQAHANYCFSYMSITSSLNFSYLNELAEIRNPRDTNILPVVDLLQNNSVMKLLHNFGYETVTFRSGYGPVDSINADLILSYPSSTNDFQDTLITYSPLGLVIKERQFEEKRGRILFTLQSLRSLKNVHQPRFIFAHIIAPHMPFVFSANGSEYKPEWISVVKTQQSNSRWIGLEMYRLSYVNQTIFITSQIDLLVNELLAQNPKPIIIIQSDHGPGMQLNSRDLEKTNINERFPIISTFYFPDQDYSMLYPNISPVNTFRVILDQYLDTQLELLEDRSFWTPQQFPYDQQDITDQLDIKP